MSLDAKTEEWQIRMREVQGAICVASVFQVMFGYFGNDYFGSGVKDVLSIQNINKKVNNIYTKRLCFTIFYHNF